MPSPAFSLAGYSVHLALGAWNTVALFVLKWNKGDCHLHVYFHF